MSLSRKKYKLFVRASLVIMAFLIALGFYLSPKQYAYPGLVKEENVLDMRRDSLRSQIIKQGTEDRVNDTLKAKRELERDPQKPLTDAQTKKLQQYSLDKARKSGEPIIHDRKINGLTENGDKIPTEQNAAYKSRASALSEWSKSQLESKDKK